MPLREITIHFWEVYAANVPIERLPEGDFKNVEKIVAEVNKIYRQARIHFTAEPLRPFLVPYDTDGNHRVGPKEHSPEFDNLLDFQIPLPARPNPKKHLNVFLVRRFDEPNLSGLTKRGRAPDRCIVQTWRFETGAPQDQTMFMEFAETIAHEIGHLLGMSVHDFLARKTGQEIPSRLENHDLGYFPFHYYKKLESGFQMQTGSSN